MQFADVKNDIAFRKIFGNEQKTAPLISFLNASLELEGDHQVVSVTIANPYQFPRNFANEDEGLKTAFLEADKYQWSKEELKAYDNVTIKEQDERGERELLTQKAKDEKELELILGMDKEGFTIPQIARVTQRSEEEIKKILDAQ